MSQTRYFTPVNGDGIVRFSQGGTGAGWYQLDMPDRILPALPGVTVPQGAVGVLIQAESAITWAQSPEVADAGASFGLEVVAGTTWFIPGYDALRRLCFKLPASGASIVLQFYAGGIGPTPFTA